MNGTSHTLSPHPPGDSPVEDRSCVGWLRSAPVCRLEGPVVYVTLVLVPDVLPRKACIAWSAGGLHATTPHIGNGSVTCCVPRGVFEHGARVELEVLGCPESLEPARAWTNVPSLEKAAFFADMSLGQPVFVLLDEPAVLP